MPGLGSSQGREAGRQAGRQLGVMGRTFLPLPSANPNPRLQAALQGPGLLRHVTHAACSGREEGLPLWLGLGGQGEVGEQAQGQG